MALTQEAITSRKYKDLLGTAVRRAVTDYRERYGQGVLTDAAPLDALFDGADKWQRGVGLEVRSADLVVAEFPFGTVRKAKAVYDISAGDRPYNGLVVRTFTPVDVPVDDQLLDFDLLEGNPMLTEVEYTQQFARSKSAHSSRPEIEFAIITAADLERVDQRKKTTGASIRIVWDQTQDRAVRMGHSLTHSGSIPEVAAGAHNGGITVVDFAKMRKAANDAVKTAKAELDVA